MNSEPDWMKPCTLHRNGGLIEDSEDAPERAPSYQVGSRRDNYVPAFRDEPVRVRRMEVLPPESHELQAPGIQRTVVSFQSSHWDRARGFSLVTLPLAAAVGVGALIIAVAFFGLNVWSLAAVTTLFLAFLATWLAAWIAFNLASPDGIGLFVAWGHFRLLRHEQKARLQRMEGYDE